MVSVMPKEDVSDKSSTKTSPERTGAGNDLSATVSRVRWLMIISALTTAIAIAAVVGVIGYRFFNRGNDLAGTIVNGTVFLPSGAHIDSTTISEGRIVVTFDMNGTTEVRFFDLKTLQQIGQLHFGTER
jgi:hypothetical protein